jgi:ribosomal protein S18 acetylase RimI-like enzyme
MKIKIIPESDVKEVVKVHNTSFQGFFLTELGDKFLRIYYNSVRKDAKGVLLGFYDEGKLFGFCAATTLSKGFNTHLVKKNLFDFCLIAMRLLFTKTNALVRLLNNFTKRNPEEEDEGDYAELLSMGVSNQRQGQGIGKQLLLQLEKELQSKGCTILSLTTDFNGNEKAIHFYKSLGYDVFYDFIAFPERKMYRMIKKIN